MLIQDVKFEPKFTAKQLKLAKDFLVERKKEFAGTANYGVVSGNKVRGHIQSACHASIFTKDTSKELSLVATEISCRNPLNKKDKECFLKWLLNDSWFGRFIVNRNDFDFCFNYGIIVSSDIPQPLLQAIMIISRHFEECGEHAFAKFRELTEDKGIDSGIAYPLCFNSGFSMKQTKLNNILCNKGTHRAFNLFSMEGFDTFLKGEINVSNKKAFLKNTYREFQSTSGVIGLFKGSSSFTTFAEELLGSDTSFKKVVSDSRKKGNTKEVYKPPNPFEPTPLRKNGLKPGQFTYEETFDVVTPYLQKLLIVKT